MNTIWPVNPSIPFINEPPIYEFQRPNNEDWVQQFNLNNYNQATNTRSPFNLSGVEIKIELVGSSSGEPSMLLSTVNTYIAVPSSGDLGEFIIQVPAAIMWTLPAGIYNGDCLLFLPNGSIINAFGIQITITAGFTAPTP